MTSTTWLFCFAILCTIAAYNQAQTYDPLVMAVYIQENQSKRITFTDLTSAKVDDLKLPLDGKEPSFIVLLCGDKTSYNWLEIVQITDKIDSIQNNLKCFGYPQPYLYADDKTTLSSPIVHSIGFRFRVTDHILRKNVRLLSEEIAAGIESFKLLVKFAKSFNMYSEPFHHNETHLKIQYDFTFNIPKVIEHTVKARMHSYTHDEKCQELDISTHVLNEKRSFNELDNQYVSQQPPSNHHWQQLASIQDFKGIYTTRATCIYLNYTLVHKNAITNLNSIEIYIRMVADVLNEVRVVTGTYIKEGNNSDPKPDETGNTIPTIVWKNISYFGNDKWYDILVVIHNKESERICNEEEAWGWPNGNNNKQATKIGTMYYCSMNSHLSDQLGLVERNEYLPLDLRKVPHKTEKIDVQKIISKKCFSNNAIVRLLSSIITCGHPQHKNTTST